MTHDIENLLRENAQLINERIEKYIPRRYRADSLIFRLNPPRYTPDLEALDRAISEPTWEFLDRGGKRWRPTLFLLVCEALGSDPKEYLDFAVIPEIIHNGTLIADDIEDSSEFRRGKPCTYRIFGLDIAINVSNFLYFIPMIVLSENRNKINPEKARRLYEIYVHEMVNLSIGQAMDIAWHRGLIDADKITEEHYLQMCIYKTGTLARMAAKMAAILADAEDEVVDVMGRFAESIGVAFQIQDDVLDLTGEAFAKGKGGVGMDITEGKRTLIVIHTLREAAPTDRRRLIEILNMHTRDPKLRMEAINIMKKYGSIEYARRAALRLKDESWNEVDKILPESKAKERLRALADYLVEREI